MLRIVACIRDTMRAAYPLDRNVVEGVDVSVAIGILLGAVVGVTVVSYVVV